jgi:hypothetical protein
MLANTSVTRRVLGGVVGVNLALALAVSAGAVPRPGDNVHTANAAHIEEVAAPAARQPGDTGGAAAAPAPAPAPAAQTPAPTTVVPTTVVKPAKSTPPTTKAPRAAAAPKTTAPAPAVPAAPVVTVPPAVTTVARRVPTPAEVQGVIAELKRRVPMLNFVSIPTTKIDEIGNQVCTAFDSGQSFAQVKTTGLSMLPAGISVPVGTDDWAVRQAVARYCPGHANKLV